MIDGRAPPDYWMAASPFTSRSNTEAAWQIVYSAAREAGKELEVVSALGQFPPMDCMIQVELDVLKEAMKGDEGQRHAATLVKLCTIRWRADEVDSVAAQLLGLIESDSQWFEDWMDYVETASVRGELLEAGLLKMLKTASPTHRQRFESRWSGLLSRVVERRPAPIALPDPSPTRPMTMRDRP